MKICPNCNSFVDDNANFCENCGQKIIINNQQTIVSQQSESQIQQISEKQPLDSVNMQQVKTSQKGAVKKKGKVKLDFGRFFGGIIGVIIVAIIFGVVDDNTTDKLIGTWTYTENIVVDEKHSFDAVVNLDLKDGSYEWYIDEEKTRQNMDEMYESMIVNYEITESDVKDDGYSSIADFKQACIDENIDSMIYEYNSVTRSGKWRIENNSFLFTETGATEEYRTLYEIDGDTLILETDGITLSKVK